MKDAYYFSHDSNAKDDPKCVLLIEQLGLEGYGIYWVLIEVLRDQPEYKYPIALIPSLARKYNTTAEKMKTVVSNYGLFTLDENDFFSMSLLDRMEQVNIRRMSASNAGKKSAQKRLESALSEENQRSFNGRSTDVQPNKGKEKKEKENKSALDDALENFVLFRKKIRKPLTDYAIKLLIDKLNNLAQSEDEKVLILNQSILNGWMGVFPLKKDFIPVQEKQMPML